MHLFLKLLFCNKHKVIIISLIAIITLQNVIKYKSHFKCFNHVKQLMLKIQKLHTPMGVVWKKISDFQ